MGRHHVRCEFRDWITFYNFLLRRASRADGIQWSEGRIVALLVLAFGLLIAFALIQVWKPEQATLPPHIFIQRSIASGFWVSSCLGAHQTVFGKFATF
jgi:hypothetical protein